MQHNSSYHGRLLYCLSCLSRPLERAYAASPESAHKLAGKEDGSECESCR